MPKPRILENELDGEHTATSGYGNDEQADATKLYILVDSYNSVLNAIAQEDQEPHAEVAQGDFSGTRFFPVVVGPFSEVSTLLGAKPLPASAWSRRLCPAELHPPPCARSQIAMSLIKAVRF